MTNATKSAAKSNAPREGSRKRKVYDTFKNKGKEEALKVGASLKLKASTLRTWMQTCSR